MLAQIKNPVLSPLIREKTGEEYAAGLLPRLVTMALIIGSVLFLFYLLIGAIKWITSGGDKQRLESARGTVAQAIIGLLVLFSVFAIANLVERAFGFNIIEFSFPALE
jgi:hypothetical protein